MDNKKNTQNEDKTKSKTMTITSSMTSILNLFKSLPSSSSLKTNTRIQTLEQLLKECTAEESRDIYNKLHFILKVDFLAVFPAEVSLRIFQFLDAKGLCHASLVCKNWNAFAEDDVLWYRLCRQHIDRKCTKCGWGLPLMMKKRHNQQQQQVSSSAPVSAEEIESNIEQSLNRKRKSGDNDLTSSKSHSPTDSITEQPKNVQIEDECQQDSGSSSYLPPLSSEKKLKLTVEEDQAINNGSTKIDTKNVGIISKENTNQRGVAKIMTGSREWKSIYKERLLVERNWRRGRYICSSYKAHQSRVTCLQIHERMGIVVTGSADHTINIYKLERSSLLNENSTSQHEHEQTLHGHESKVTCIQFDESKLISGSADGVIKIWSTETWDCKRTWMAHQDGGVSALHYKDRILVTAGNSGIIRVWHIGANSSFELTGHTQSITGVQVCGKWLFSCSLDRTVRMWDLEKRQVFRVFKGKSGQLTAMHVVTPHHHGSGSGGSSNNAPTSSANPSGSPDHINTPSQPFTAIEPFTGWKLYTSSDNGTVKIWDLKSTQCLHTLDSHDDPVVDIHATSLRFITCASGNRKLSFVWDDSGKIVFQLGNLDKLSQQETQQQQQQHHNTELSCIRMSDTKVVIGRSDGMVFVYDFGVNDESLYTR